MRRKLTALALLITASISGNMLAAPNASAQSQPPKQVATGAKKLCQFRKVTTNFCTVIVDAPIGVTIRSGPGSNYKKIGAIPYGYDVQVKITPQPQDWVKLVGRPGWIHSQYLVKAGD